MSEKYYIPDISEFHAGFEYEENNPWSNTWNKEIFDSVLYDDNRRYHFIDGTYDRRVKYLDKEDIESLGFQVRKEPNGTDPYLFRLKLQKLIFPHHPELHTVYLAIHPFIGRCIIYLQEDDIVGNEKVRPEVQLFNGIIKNKSELKKLMKQLGI